MVDHFKTTGHNPSNITIDISGHAGEVIEVKSYLRDNEVIWIKYLMTTYHFGFNDQIKGYGNI